MRERFERKSTRVRWEKGKDGRTKADERKKRKETEKTSLKYVKPKD